MRKVFHVSGRKKTSQVELIDDNSVVVDNERHSYSFERLADGTFMFFLDGRGFSIVDLRSMGMNEGEIGESGEILLVDGHEFSLTVDDEQSLLLKSLLQSQAPSSASVTIRAPMPGLVTKIEVSVGQQVNTGDGLLILEAMKMENEVRCPEKGTVKEIHVGPQTPVEKGSPLITIEH